MSHTNLSVSTAVLLLDLPVISTSLSVVSPLKNFEIDIMNSEFGAIRELHTRNWFDDDEDDAFQKPR